MAGHYDGGGFFGLYFGATQANPRVNPVTDLYLGGHYFGVYFGTASPPARALIRSAVAAVLTADPGVSALVGLRVYPSVVSEDNPSWPALTYQLVAATRERDVNGPSGLSRALFQVACVSRSNTDGEAVIEAVRQCLDGPASPAVAAGGGYVTIIGATLDGERDHTDRGPDGTDRPLYVTSADYLIRYREPRPRGL